MVLNGLIDGAPFDGSPLLLYPYETIMGKCYVDIQEGGKHQTCFMLWLRCRQLGALRTPLESIIAFGAVGTF